MAHETNLTPREQYLKEQYTEMVDAGPDGFRVRLNIDVQSFTLELTFAPDEADWTRGMLAKALDTLLELESADQVAGLTKLHGAHS